MAATQKGRQTNTFPALRMADNTLVEDPNLKAEAFKAQFFPPVHPTIEIDQPNNPPPLPTCTWDPISYGEVSQAL